MKKPPNWKNFDFWVLVSAGVGLGIAIAVFLGLRRFLFDADSGTGDIISATATALGSMTIGGVAIMQFRKHKWAEYQAKLDEDSRTGERLSKAVEHLGDKDNLHIRLGAVYEFKNLADDSPRNNVNIVSILTAFIKSHVIHEGQSLSQDVQASIDVLSQVVRCIIEVTSRESRRKNRFRMLSFEAVHNGNSRIFFYIKKMFRIYHLKPPQCIFDATKELSNLITIDWRELKADKLDLDGIVLKDANLWAASFKSSCLIRANLQGTRFVFARFEGTDLREILVDSNSIAKWSLFSGAYVNKYTQFDDGVELETFRDNFQTRIQEITFSK